MAWQLHIDPDVNCAFIKHHGAYNIDDAGNRIRSIINHPDHRDSMNVLHDFRNIRVQPDISYASLSEAFKAMSQVYDGKAVKCKSAMVVGDAQSYSKFHQYVVSGRLGKSPVERKVFRDIEKALRWLGIPESYEIKYPAPDETA